MFVSACARAEGGEGAAAGVRVRSAWHGRGVASLNRGCGVGGLHGTGSALPARVSGLIVCVKEEGCGGVCLHLHLCRGRV